MPKLTTSYEQRLINKRKITANGCWEWLGSVSNRYGTIRINSKTYRVHRVSYELFIAPITNGLSVLHKCDNPICFNPAHLFLGTQLDNMRDCAAKGRAHTPFCPPEMKARGDKNGMRLHPDCLAGEKNGRSKVSDESRKVIAIRKALGETAKALAEEYKLHMSQINRIARRFAPTDSLLIAEYARRTYVA